MCCIGWTSVLSADRKRPARCRQFYRADASSSSEGYFADSRSPDRQPVNQLRSRGEQLTFRILRQLGSSSRTGRNSHHSSERCDRCEEAANSDMQNRRLHACAVLLFLVISIAVPCRAQQFPTLGVSNYVGQNVSSIDVAGRPGISYDSVQSDVAVKPNQPLTEKDVNATVSALKDRLGVKDVAVNLQPSAEGVQIEFVLRPAVWVGMYDFPGALGEFPYTRLLQVSNYNPQTPYSASDIKEGEDSLTQFFRQQGYFRAEVNAKLVEEEQHELVNVQFQTHLGIRARLGKVSLEGATPEETAYLQTRLRSVMAKL